MSNFSTNLFNTLYGEDVAETQKQRYENVAQAWKLHFGHNQNERGLLAKTQSILRFFSSPGRTEIGGNHTDHNLGKVLAASVELDCIAAVAIAKEQTVYIHDISYNKDFSIDLQDTERKNGEEGSIALVRGLLHGFKSRGYNIGGLKICLTTNVISAAGLSSSAAFEMLICQIINSMFNNGKIPIDECAKIGQFAENTYWDKASGLLDQMACGFGGLVAINFKNPEKLQIKKIAYDFNAHNYQLIIVNTGKGHSDLSAEYSAIPNEMKSVARTLGHETLHSLSFEEIYTQLPLLREKCGDRAVLRALHFFEENNRVDNEVTALENDNFADFLKNITESGNSSWKWLQNVYVSAIPEEQSIAVVLALTERFIKNKGQGACRIHGGGFAGVIQVFLPREFTAEYTKYIEKALGFDASNGQKSPVYPMNIRPFGSIEVN